MEDKKNIVIKLKYPASGKKAEPDVSASKVITEWNIKRIVLALLGVVFFIVALFFLFKPATQNTDLQPHPALPEKIIKPPVKSETDINSNAKINSDVKINNNAKINKNIIRALLTFKIKHNDPAGEIILPLKLSKKRSTSVYYFVELSAMKGRTVYHEWLLNGELVTRKKVKISDDGKWRTFSRQFFANSVKTNWTVRLVDETGQVLNEIPFKVIYE